MAYNPRDLVAPRFLRSSDAGDVASANERAVLRQIRMNPRIQRTALNERLDLTQQSVYRIVETLVDRGMILLGDPLPGTGRGQPSPTLTLNPAYAASFGISLNTDACNMCLTSFRGEALATEFFALEGRPMETIIDRIIETADNMRRGQDIPAEAVLGVGFGFPGYNVGGTKFNGPLPLHEWSLIELGPLLHDRLGLPVWVANGANASAIGESLYGVGRHIRDFAYLSFNYGFGGGIIVDGELFLGAGGNAGEFGGMFRDEEMADRPALQSLIEELAKNDIVIPGIHKLRDLFQEDWPGVDAWVERVTPQYNRFVNALWSILDPAAVVFGGELPRPLARRLIANTQIFGRPRYGVAQRYPKLIISEMEGNAAVLGAASLPFKDMIF